MDAADLTTARETVPQWQTRDSRLERDFAFPSFVEAFAFMAGVALLAEKRDHHPDWSNSYNRVSISLTTHSSGGLTEKDFELAQAIDRLADER